jgi:hypothetical protein
LKSQEINFHELFKHCESVTGEKAHGLVAENVTVNRDDFKKVLIDLGVFTTEDDFV